MDLHKICRKANGSYLGRDELRQFTVRCKNLPRAVAVVAQPIVYVLLGR